MTAPVAAGFAARPGTDNDRSDRAGKRRPDGEAGAPGSNDRRHDPRSGKERERPGSSAIRRDLASRSVEEVCGDLGGEIVNGLPLCTHGPDPAPPGLNPAADVAPTRRAWIAPGVACVGDGSSGARIEVLYVYPSDVAGGNRYDRYLASFHTWVVDMDKMFRDSAAVTDGERRLRIVTDAACRPVVTPVGVPAAALKSFGGSIDAVSGQGFNRKDRNYLMFVDANVLCGIGTVRGDDRPGQENWNNTGGGYARIDAGCWNGFTAAHEVMHNLGGVQPGAPNDSGGWHCTDEHDIMCYRDSPNFPPMREVCASGPWSSLSLFDCGQDDYFSANPAPGSYLTRKWNTANSRFLVDPATLPSDTPDADSEPTPSPDQGPTVVLPESEGAVGGRMVVEVAGFPAGELLTVWFDGVAAGSATVDDDGAARLMLTTPAGVAGEHTVAAAAGSVRAETSFRIVPAARASRPRRSRGPVAVALTGFAAGERIAARVGGGEPIEVVADASGSAATGISAPPRARGKRTVFAVGSVGNEAADAVNFGKRSRKGKDKGNGGRVRGGGGDGRPVLAPIDGADERSGRATGDGAPTADRLRGETP